MNAPFEVVQLCVKRYDPLRVVLEVKIKLHLVFKEIRFNFLIFQLNTKNINQDK